MQILCQLSAKKFTLFAEVQPKICKFCVNLFGATAPE